MQTLQISGIQGRNYAALIEKQWQLLEESKVSAENKKLIADFITFIETAQKNKVGESRRRMYLYELRVLGEIVGKQSFKEMKEADILRMVSAVQKYKRCICPRIRIKGKLDKVDCGLTKCEGRPYSDNSVREFYKIIQKFWKWMYECGKHEKPEPIRRLDFTLTELDKDPDIHSEEEIKKIVDFQPSPMRQLFFACLYDFMAREDEILSRRVGHVRRNEQTNEWEMKIESTKTKKAHMETAFFASPYFTVWMRLHPQKDNPNAPLFSMISNNGSVAPLRYASARNYYFQTCKALKIKPIKLHSFRAAGATYADRRGISATSIERRGSWAKGSKELRKKYLRSDREQVDKEFRAGYGLEVQQEEKPKVLMQCPNCPATIASDSKFCSVCGHATTQKAHYDRAEEREMFEQLLEEKLKQRIDDYISQKFGVGKE